MKDTKTTDNAKMLTVDDVCQLLGISRWTVYSLTKQGKLPVIKLTKRTFRYNSKDVEKLTVAKVAI